MVAVGGTRLCLAASRNLRVTKAHSAFRAAISQAVEVAEIYQKFPAAVQSTECGESMRRGERIPTASRLRITWPNGPSCSAVIELAA